MQSKHKNNKLKIKYPNLQLCIQKRERQKMWEISISEKIMTQKNLSMQYQYILS